jgi:hypothetical protein
MQQLHIQNSQSVNGSKPVNGKGLKRRKLTLDERVKLAVDLVTGEKPFKPSVTQACGLVSAPQRAVAAELKARAARENGHQPPRTPVAALIEAWDQATELEREVALEDIGVGAVWDALFRIVR